MTVIESFWVPGHVTWLTIVVRLRIMKIWYSASPIHGSSIGEMDPLFT